MKYVRGGIRFPPLKNQRARGENGGKGGWNGYMGFGQKGIKVRMEKEQVEKNTLKAFRCETTDD